MSRSRTLALLTGAVLLASCASTPLPLAVEKGTLDNAPDGSRIVLKRDGEVMVKLDTNITTGFQWQMPAVVEPVLTPIGKPIYVGYSAESRYVGGGGGNIFRFRGAQPGKATLMFEHRRPWETSAAPDKTLHYEVIVE